MLGPVILDSRAANIALAGVLVTGALLFVAGWSGGTYYQAQATEQTVSDAVAAAIAELDVRERHPTDLEPATVPLGQAPAPSEHVTIPSAGPVVSRSDVPLGELVDQLEYTSRPAAAQIAARANWGSEEILTRAATTRGRGGRGEPGVTGAAVSEADLAPAPLATATVFGGAAAGSHEPAQVAEIERFLAGWRDAWETADLRRYASFYSREFATPGLDRRSWLIRKYEVFQRSYAINVRVDDLRVEPTADGYRADFLQSYSSNLVNDRGRKTLDLVRDAAGWKIRREQWHPIQTSRL